MIDEARAVAQYAALCVFTVVMIGGVLLAAAVVAAACHRVVLWLLNR